ncbi:hypothetical protein NC651_035455 [Populus alba x Populus x berolinensis]|nr:hypothetical protein NC651_035455 [Populus alba x Populus x berolinensis]
MVWPESGDKRQRERLMGFWQHGRMKGARFFSWCLSPVSSGIPFVKRVEFFLKKN